MVREEAESHQHLAYYSSDDHNMYLTPADPTYPVSHVRNRLVNSSKGCITDDQIPQTSALRSMYDSTEFRTFLSAVLDEAELHAYADPLSSINVHYASDGQELGWHFDNSSFAITLMIQKPDAGGEFEYVRDLRKADASEMNSEASAKVLDDETKTHTLSMEPGTLVMFWGRNSMHRVTPPHWRPDSNACRIRLQHKAGRVAVGISAADVFRVGWLASRGLIRSASALYGAIPSQDCRFQCVKDLWA